MPLGEGTQKSPGGQPRRGPSGPARYVAGACLPGRVHSIPTGAVASPAPAVGAQSIPFYLGDIDGRVR